MTLICRRWLARLMGIVGATASMLCGEEPRVSNTLYVSRHFEVRDHDQPVKYVFNGETRVARITGSLSSRLRLQRLRLQSGWNVVSIAVTATNLAEQLNQFGDGPSPRVGALYRWRPATRDYAAVMTGQTVGAGSVLWVKSRTNAVVAVVGAYVEPAANTALAAGGGYISSAGLDTWSPALPTGVTIWRYDSRAVAWRAGFSGDLAAMSDAPPALAPGDAIYVHTQEAIELEIPDSARQILYYHSDHLGSSTAITDAAGNLVEETAFYPFGAIRHEARLRPIEGYYQFTQKERDRESGLLDFGHRYYHAATARWLSPDPMGEKGGGLNPYAYASQNPLKHYDPDGAEIKVKVDNKKQPTTYEITLKAVFIDVSSTKFSQKELAQFAENLKSTIEASFKGSDGKIRWVTKVDLRVVKDWSEVKKDDHVFRVVDKADGAGETTLGGMLMNIKASRYTQLKPDDPRIDRTNPANKHFTWENYTSSEGTGTHEFGHAAGLRHDDLRPNLMQNGDIRKSDNKDVSLQQIQTIWKAYEANQLNKREPVLDDLTKSR